MKTMMVYGTIIECQPQDTSPPTASPTQDPAANTYGWNNTDVTITWNWADEEGGSGIDEDNCQMTTLVTDEGEHMEVTATCYDLAGNMGSATYYVSIDKTAPAANPTQDPAANVNGWNNTEVTITWNWSDDGSGLDNCTASSTKSAEGQYNVTDTCSDLAGNSYEASYAVKIDKTPPTFGACPAGGPFYLNSGMQPVGPISVDASISGLDAALSTLSGSVSPPSTTPATRPRRTAPTKSFSTGTASSSQWTTTNSTPSRLGAPYPLSSASLETRA
jgi:hypothetical protein